MARRTPRTGRWRKRYQRERGGSEVAIWGYLKLRETKQEPEQLVEIGFAKQEGDQRDKRTHAEARWLTQHRARLEYRLTQYASRVVQVEFDLTKDPCTEYCRPMVFPEIRRICTAKLSDRGVTPIYIFLDVEGKDLVFDHFVEVSPTGVVSSPPQPDI